MWDWKNLRFLDENYNKISLVGIDISEDMLKQINYNFKNKVKLLKMDILDYEETSLFKYIILKQVFHHLIEKEKVLKKIENLLDNSGKIILMFPNEKYNSNYLNYTKNDVLGRLSKEDFEEFLTNTNLRINIYETDEAEFIFDNLSNYVNFLYSIGSLQKMFEYEISNEKYNIFFKNFGKILEKTQNIKMKVSYSYVVLEKR